jgi:hypothetical protein
MKRRIAGLAVTAWAALYLVPTVAAQTATGRDMKGRPGLVFEFNGLDLEALDGAVGLKLWASRKMTLTAGLGFLNDKNRTEDTAGGGGLEQTNSRIGLIVALEHHFAPKAVISPFWGVSLGFGTSDYRYDYLPADDGSSTTGFHATRTTFLTPRVFLGAEVFLLESVSLSGFYGLGLERQWGRTEEEITYPFDTVPAASEGTYRATRWWTGTSGLRLTIYL